jgi:hypothetical protein
MVAYGARNGVNVVQMFKLNWVSKQILKACKNIKELIFLLKRKNRKHFNKAITTTASDRYADFKIGAIFHLFDEKRWQFEYYLKITHRCNQVLI